MNMNELYYSNNELYHWGVKGMKWGVRRYQNADGSLTPRGVKKYATKGYAQDSYKSNKTVVGKAKYEMSSNSYNRERAEQYLKDKQTTKSDNMIQEQKSAKRKKAIKIEAAAVGTALAAYGGYKVYKFVREKNQDIRLNQGKAKCDRMLKKLDRMRINDYVNGSSGTEKWTKPRSYKRTGLQYNNNGKTVTLAREYRNTQMTLNPTQYRNIGRKVTEKAINEAFDRAKKDSFVTAAKNVSKYYLDEAKRNIKKR